MSSMHIEITSTASRLSALVRGTVDRGRNFQEDIEQIVDVAQQVASGADWDALATKLGVSAGEAETVYNLLVALNNAMGVAVFNDVLDRLG